eukprot:1159347-Pelagomonas_calceolata.AAC.11
MQPCEHTLQKAACPTPLSFQGNPEPRGPHHIRFRALKLVETSAANNPAAELYHVASSKLHMPVCLTPYIVLHKAYTVLAQAAHAGTHNNQQSGTSGVGPGHHLPSNPFIDPTKPSYLQMQFFKLAQM